MYVVNRTAEPTISKSADFITKRFAEMKMRNLLSCRVHKVLNEALSSSENKNSANFPPTQTKNVNDE